MSRGELRQAAIACLAKVFNGDTTIASYVVQAAVSIVLMPEAGDVGSTTKATD
jgi:hypothetical protein